jgi:hypothetical protein
MKEVERGDKKIRTNYEFNPKEDNVDNKKERNAGLT